MYEDEIMETVTRKAEPKRTRKDIFTNVLYTANILLASATVVVLLLKYVIGVWHGIPGWVPRAMFAVGWCAIWVALSMKEDK